MMVRVEDARVEERLKSILLVFCICILIDSGCAWRRCISHARQILIESLRRRKKKFRTGLVPRHAQFCKRTLGAQTKEGKFTLSLLTGFCMSENKSSTYSLSVISFSFAPLSSKSRYACVFPPVRIIFTCNSKSGMTRTTGKKKGK